MPTNKDLVALDAEAVRTSVDVVARATAGDLVRPTPCAGWTLRDLLGHMAAQHYGFAAASRGEADIAVWQPRPLGDDPVGAYRAAAQHVLEAFAVDGVTERAFPLPEIRDGGPFPGAQAVSFHLVDYVVHSWDVARTLGHTVTFDPELLDAALAVARVVPGGEARLGPGAAFAPAVAADGGTRLDEIVATLGRSPAWQPTPT
ncbi:MULTISPECIES: TIGR03086 family metal-binding protein [unclassified Streptomyces]|uniref:TIGR03086 family metal-binding protein n=1 Tax=unclassified Streptomyces TaxID=2593676 RepID=UPI002DD87089|nr:TIGR03086 family metal-binding protein [Streptomyces sp. NBC_01445]WSE02769.1 TIGR03086 family metal-binding protein [Streptomyces sp. NBC_01445]